MVKLDSSPRRVGSVCVWCLTSTFGQITFFPKKCELPVPMRDMRMSIESCKMAIVCYYFYFSRKTYISGTFASVLRRPI